MTYRVLTGVLLILVVSIAALSQQEKSKRASPPAQAQCKFADGKTISADYSSPRAKGRKIFGELVPYGQVWRTGANEATAFTTNAELSAKGANVPPGSYTLFTIPNADRWTLIINKHTGEWGIPYKYESEELAKLPMTVSKTSAPVENFTISFDHSGSTCNLLLSWENTVASVEFTERK